MEQAQADVQEDRDRDGKEADTADREANASARHVEQPYLINKERHAQTFPAQSAGRA